MNIIKKELNVTGRKIAKGVVIGFLSILALLVIISTLTGQTNAKDDKKTLQESVEISQADYDLSQSQALDAMKSYCKSWAELSNAKAQLSAAMKINATTKIVDVKVCEGVYVPVSF